ncbi:MAG: ribose-phosphate pyrophosphokinase [Enhygromyxa sp.]
MSEIALFSLDSGRALLERIARRLALTPGRHEERDFEDGEHKIRPLENVRGRDVYVVQSLFGDPARSVNDKLARVLFFLGALRDAGAERVTAVAPYLCYARKDRRTKPRDPVTTRYVAALFEALGADRVVVVDVHNPAAYENAFRIPSVHLTAAPLLVEALAPRVGEREVVVVSPDAGGVKRADRFREALEQRLERSVGFAFMEKFRSEGVVRGGAVIGEVEGRVAVIVDDLVASGTTLVRAATACRERGATSAYAAVTHGVFSEAAERSLSAAALERLLVTDTIAVDRLDPAFVQRRIVVIDCAPLLAEAISRLHAGESVVELCG